MGEKNEVKVRLGTVVCLFIIVLLILGLVGMYLYYNKNNSNTIVGTDYEVEINEIGEQEKYKTSEFESIYKSLVDSEYSNLKSFITSDNKIKEIRVSGITIYTEDYLNATRGKLSEDSNENKIMGSCIFTVEFEDIKGLTLAGSKGNIHAIEGNCLIDEKEFIFDKKTNKIELCTSLYKNEQVTEENIKYTYEGIKGLYTYTTEESSYSLYLWENGTFQYEHSFDSSDGYGHYGRIGNYIIEDNVIKLNYLFSTGTDISLSVTKGNKELKIDAYDRITFTDEDFNNNKIVLKKDNDKEINEAYKNHDFFYLINEYCIFNKYNGR